MNNDLQRMRAELWCQVYAASISNTQNLAHSADFMADRAVMLFDKVWADGTMFDGTPLVYLRDFETGGTA